MNDFKKNNRFGGKRDFNRPSFGNKEFGRPMQMYAATCAQCGKSCEVPFKPNGRKPVFCKECFDKTEGRAPSAPSFAPRQFDRPSFKPDFKQSFKPQGDNRQIEDLKRQMDTINFKLDKLIQMASPAKPVAPVAAPKPAEKSETVGEVVKKVLAKKAASKKKK